MLRGVKRQEEGRTASPASEKNYVNLVSQSRISSAVNPSISTLFCRAHSPLTIRTARRGTPRCFAISLTRPSFAAPSTGGALRRTSNRPSLIPANWVRDERGITRTGITTPSPVVRSRSAAVLVEPEAGGFVRGTSRSWRSRPAASCLLPPVSCRLGARVEQQSRRGPGLGGCDDGARRRADRAGPPGVGSGVVLADLVILKPIAVLLLHGVERVAQRHDRALD